MIKPLQHTVAIMRDGGVIACPTEAVWGLSCDPGNEAAVNKILSLKDRERTMGLILVAASMKQLMPLLTNLNAEQLETLRQSWPGPNTWLIPHNGVAPEWITGGRDTLAVRVTAHPLTAALCDAFGGPVVSTSANPHGLPPATTATEVEHYFGTGLDGILQGETGGKTSVTSIRDLVSGAIIRS